MTWLSVIVKGEHFSKSQVTCTFLLSSWLHSSFPVPAPDVTPIARCCHHHALLWGWCYLRWVFGQTLPSPQTTSGALFIALSMPHSIFTTEIYRELLCLVIVLPSINSVHHRCHSKESELFCEEKYIFNWQ